MDQTSAQKRQKLMEIMVRTHLITTDLANYHIARWTDAQVDEQLALRTNQRTAE